MKQVNASRVLLRLWRHIASRRRKQLGLLLILIVLASLAEAVSIGAIVPFLGVLINPESLIANSLAAQLIEPLGPTKGHHLIVLLTSFFILAALFAGAMRLILVWAQTRLGYAIGADLSIEIYKKTLYQPYSIHISRNSSEIIAGISSKTDSVIGTTLLPILYIVSSVLMLVAIMATLIYVNSAVAFGVLSSFGSIYILIIIATRKRLAFDSSHISREANQVIKALQEGLGGIRDVLIDGTQKTYCQIYRKADLRMRRSQASIQIIQASPRYLVESLGMVTIAILAYSLAINYGESSSVIPLLGVLALGAQRLLPVLQQLYSSLTAMRGGHASLLDVVMLLEQNIIEDEDQLRLAPIVFSESINLKKVSFRYDETSPLILHSIDLNIPKGGRIGFVGKTGSGKSTLLDIFMALLQPISGKFAVDGQVIDNKNYRAWQLKIAHVPQAIFLADSTVAENIAFGVPVDQIDLSRVKVAAQKAQISETIEDWDKGYKTLVGERGVRLSGGQRQRIGIARALYKQAEVIILDEATSALDSVTERTVMGAISGAGSNTTVLIVAHRLSTLECCDLIVEIDQGRIVRQGSYKEIIEQDTALY